MLNRIALTLADRRLIPDTARVLLAVSGGCDSMLLLHALVRLQPRHGWSLTVAHLNHGLRGDGGVRDADSVRREAGRLGLDYVQEICDVRQLARDRRESIEMAGRHARREFLVRTARRFQISRIATGHTQDDRIETLLLNITRGIGIDALKSIPYRTVIDDACHIVRPLLDLDRAAIEAWMTQHALTWQSDPSNRDPVFRRNRIRHELLPWLQSRMNPGVRQALLRLIRQAESDNEWIDAIVMDGFRQSRIIPLSPSSGSDAHAPPSLDARRLRYRPTAIRRRILARWMAEIEVPRPRLNTATLERMDQMLCRGQPRRMTLPGGKELCWIKECLVCRPRHPPSLVATDREWFLPQDCEGDLDLPELDLRIRIERRTGSITRNAGNTPGRYPAVAAIRIPTSDEAPLRLRCRRPGDRMHPTGSGGTRKIKDILTDMGVPRDQRRRIPLLISRTDVVIWLPGYRIHNAWRVTDPSAPWLQIHIERKTAHEPVPVSQ